jgi:glycosyltransferase involved in cell wall biosynthesis
LSSLDGIIAYSQRGAEEYRLLGFAPQQVFVAPNAVVSRPEHPPPERPAQFSGKPRVLFVGRLQARKRIDLLLLACAALPEPIQPRLWVVGDGPARHEFQSQAASIYPAAEFTGARHGAELEEYFLQADLFVLPGTGGLAVQQAMSFGLPVIVAEGDGTQDDLVRAENGWLIPPDDLPRLTETLRTALSDPFRLRSMGQASYRLVVEQVNVEKMVEVFVKAILQVVH